MLGEENYSAGAVSCPNREILDLEDTVKVRNTFIAFMHSYALRISH